MFTSNFAYLTKLAYSNKTCKVFFSKLANKLLPENYTNFVFKKFTQQFDMFLLQRLFGKLILSLKYFRSLKYLIAWSEVKRCENCLYRFATVANTLMPQKILNVEKLAKSVAMRNKL